MPGGHRLLDRLRALDDRDRDGADAPRGPRCRPARRHRRRRDTGRRPPAARCATPRAVLPNAVWASIRPSPVMTRSAPASLASKSVASMTRSTPGRSANAAKRSWIGEQPEPDPAGRAGTRRVRARRARRRFEEVREASEAAVEEGDQVRGRALLRAVDRGRAGRSEQRVRHVAGDRHPDVRQVPSRSCRSTAVSVRGSPRAIAPSLAGRVHRKASSIPKPPSVVALPPMPRMTSRTPDAATVRSTSPSPLDVAWTASRSAAPPATGRTTRPSR